MSPWLPSRRGDPRRRSVVLIPALFVLGVGLAACDVGEDRDAPSDSLLEGGAEKDIDAEDAEGLPDVGAIGEEYPDEAREPESGEPLLDTASSETFGEYLVDGDGMALYVSDEDPPGESNCTGDCADDWPILSTAGELEDLEVAGGVDPELVGTINRSDDIEGTNLVQVTYRGKPLYYYRLDPLPGDPVGQGVDDTWWLMGPDGVALREAGVQGDG